MEYQHGDLGWWRQARFGMFIHWGLYAVPARHDWIRNIEKIPNEDYQKFFDRFDPDLFTPADWARRARSAGMKYMVITAKHHEGFCMWDTKFTDYKITNTPIGRDLLREVIDAFRAEGIRIGLYYSLIDWHHPEFPVDDLHPLREDPKQDELNQSRDMRKYAQYMRDQVTELLTRYGDIDVLWFDFSYPHMKRGKGHLDWESEKLLALVRRLRPSIIIDDRLDLEGAGDFVSPEQYVPHENPRDAAGNPLPWEGCQTFSGSWGYFRDEVTWKSPKQLLGVLIRHVSRGGNLLMNVGPTARGYFDHRAEKALAVYAEWMKYNGRSIYGCTEAPAELVEPECCRYTYNPETNRLYVHIFDWPYQLLELPGLGDKIAYAQLLHDGSEVRFADGALLGNSGWYDGKEQQNFCRLALPALQPQVEIPVVEIFLKS